MSPSGSCANMVSAMDTRAALPKMTLLQRLVAALTGRRPKQVLVLVATTRGTRAVPMDVR
jgi:hypothetical protein